MFFLYTHLKLLSTYLFVYISVPLKRPIKIKIPNSGVQEQPISDIFCSIDFFITPLAVFYNSPLSLRTDPIWTPSLSALLSKLQTCRRSAALCWTLGRQNVTGTKSSRNVFEELVQTKECGVTMKLSCNCFNLRLLHRSELSRQL